MTPEPEPDDTAESVRRGAALLDRARPDWAREVDTSRLDMADETADILAQLFGDYRTGFWIVTRPLSALQLWTTWEFGFGLREDWQQLANDLRRAEGWEELTGLWRSEIRLRGGKG
jgi:hypothetical protein